MLGLALRSGVLLGVLGMLAPSPALAATADQPPTVVGDSVTVYGPWFPGYVDVLADDTDDADDLAVCHWRAETSSVEFEGQPSGQSVVFAKTSKLGTYTTSYQACDYDYLVTGTVSVTVAKPVPPTIVSASSPGSVTITNPDQATMQISWTRPDGTGGDYRTLGPGDVDTVDTGLDDFLWSAFLVNDSDEAGGGPSAGSGAFDWASGSDASSAPTTSTVDATPASSTDPAAPSPADDADDVPVTHADTLTWWAGTHGAPDVLANDSSPDGSRLRVCRLGPDATSPASQRRIFASV